MPSISIKNYEDKLFLWYFFLNISLAINQYTLHKYANNNNYEIQMMHTFGDVAKWLLFFSIVLKHVMLCGSL